MPKLPKRVARLERIEPSRGTTPLANMPFDEIPVDRRAQILADFFGLQGNQLLPCHVAWIAGTSRAVDWIAQRAAINGDSAKAAADWIFLTSSDIAPPGESV